MTSARGLCLDIFPFTTVSCMLLAWERAELEETALSDSDCDEEGTVDNGEPVVKYATEEQYQGYVSHLTPPSATHTPPTHY
jgi:hypothetical protein